VEVHELHLRPIDALLGEALARGKHYFGLVLLLVADGDAIPILLVAGGAEGVDEVELDA
jgi:hypothetical protein